MRQWIAERGLHAKAIGKSWWSVLAALYAAFWGLDEAIEKWNPLRVKASWDAYTTHLPSHWQEWLIGLLVLSIIALIDGSYRHHRRALESLDADHKQALKKTSDELEAAKSSLVSLGKPDIKGEILAVFWEVYKDANQMPWPKHSRFYVKLRLVNHNDIPCTVDRYLITAEDCQANRVGRGEGSPSDAGRLYHPTYGYEDENTERLEGRNHQTTTWTRTKPIDISAQWPLERACKHEGWVTFIVWNFIPFPITQLPQDDRRNSPEECVASWQQLISVCVIDSLGNPHWITNILADVAPARYTRALSGVR